MKTRLPPPLPPPLRMKGKKTPLRRCVGCREMKGKTSLIRVVWADGDFSVDKPGKAQARGAYICPNSECLKKAQKSKGFERSFKRNNPKTVIYAQLIMEVTNPCPNGLSSER